MKIERTKNATRNILYGTVLKLFQIVVPFVMRTVMIYFMGVQYLGLNSLFTSILQALNLAELGVGSAMVYSMYKPIVEDDEKAICALMHLYKSYYRVIGLIIAILGILLTPAIPKLISGEIPAGINVYILYLLNLSATVLSYWLFAYKNSLLQAHQRIDVTSKVTLITNAVQYLAQFLVLWLMRNYYMYVIVALGTQTMTNIITSLVVDKIYPAYKPIGKLEDKEVKEINQRIKDLFTSKLGGTIVNSADTIVISAFLGLSMLAIYQNYYYIMNSVMGFFMIMFNSCTAGIGNSLVVDSKEKNYFDFKKLSLLTIWLASICISCFACLYQPFMKLWVGSDYLLDIKVVVLLCFYFYLYLLNQLSSVYKDAGGIWHQDRFRPLVGGVANLIMNLIMVEYIGIYGIMLSTIISYMLITMPWLIHNLFKTVFQVSPWPFAAMLVKGAVISVIISVVCYIVCSLIAIDGFIGLVIYGMICVVLTNVMLLIIYRKSESFNPLLELGDKFLKYKFHSVFVKLRYARD